MRVLVGVELARLYHTSLSKFNILEGEARAKRVCKAVSLV